MTESASDHHQYNMSFSTGGLFLNESILISEKFDQTQDWTVTRQIVTENNLIQSRTKSSAQRRIREICARLMLLTPLQLHLIVTGSRSEQQYLIWLAICKKHLFIREFAVEVIREKFLRMDLLLSHEEYDSFFTSKSGWHDELNQLKRSTYTKLRQVLFKVLREAEIISEASMILPALLSPEFIRVVSDEHPQLLRIFPIADQDIITR